MCALRVCPLERLSDDLTRLEHMAQLVHDFKESPDLRGYVFLYSFCFCEGASTLAGQFQAPAFFEENRSRQFIENVRRCDAAMKQVSVAKIQQLIIIHVGIIGNE